MVEMGRRVDLSFIIRIWLVLVSIKTSQCENAEPRALDLSVPWRPIPYHVPQQQLISVASFDTTSKDELVHIAQHNAHILKQFNQPITQYQNQNTHQIHPLGGQQAHKQPVPLGGQTPGPKYMTTPLLLTNISPAAAMQTTARHAKPFGPKSDQITTLNLVHSPTPKLVTPMSGHLAPVGVKAAKFNGQFREPVHNAPSASHQKATVNPQHPVMNKLQTHMAVAYRQKQPIAATSNRLEHYVSPNHLYGTYIQFGQASSPLQSAKSKFISQLASHPNFDAQLKGLLHAGVGGGYQQTFSQIKNLQKMNYFQQQNKLQPYYNNIPSAEIDLPKKLHSSVEKDATKTPITPSTPLFPHIPPSVLTPFFQQVQQQQQNKYGFSLKTQHPAPPAASPHPNQHFQEKPQHQFDSQQVHPTPLQHHGTESFGFTSYQSHQQPPFDHKPHETIKFKDNKHVFNEVRDEYSKNLVPPPPSTQQAFIPTAINHPEPSKDTKEILNKYNIKSHSPLQDANRFSYESYARPSAISHTPTTTPSTTFFSSSSSSQSPPSTTPRQPFYGHTITFGGDHNGFNSQVMVTPVNDDWIGRDKFITTEKPNVFRNLFRQQDSEYKQHKLMHPSYTGLPPNKRPSPTTPLSTIDSSTEEPIITHSFFTIEDAISDPTLIPPNSRNKYKYTTEAEENRLDDSQPEIVTIGSSLFDSFELGTTTPYPMFKAKGRRRRPKPSTEQSTESDSTETPDRLNRNRFRFRQRPTTEANEFKTTPPPPTPYVAEESSLKKLRKKLPSSNFSRNRLPSSNNESDQEQQDNPVTQLPPVTTTTTSTFSTPASFFNFNSDSNGLRSRFRPGSIFDVKPTRTRSKFSDDPEDPFKSSEVTRDNENSRLNFKLTNTKPSLRLPSSSPSFGPSTSSTFTSFTSDETSGEVNRTKPELNRPRFSIKEYRNKLNRTTSSTSTTTPFGSLDLEVTTQPATKLRFPTRNRFMLNARQNKTTESNEVISSGFGFGNNIIGGGSSTSTTTEKSTVTNETTTTRTSFRPTGTRNFNRFTVKKATTEAPQQQPSSTITSRVVNRGRIRLQDTTTQATPNRTSVPGSLNTSTLANRRPAKISLRQRIQNYNRKKDSDAGLKDPEQENNSLLNTSEEAKPIDDLSMVGSIDTQNRYEDNNSPAPSSTSTSTTTTEGYRHPETAIMKISPKDSSSSNNNDGDWDLSSASSDYSKRVVELTLSASKDKGFKSVNKGLLSRRVPGYFTLATEDPILPIEAFFPQVKKVSA